MIQKKKKKKKTVDSEEKGENSCNYALKQAKGIGSGILKGWPQLGEKTKNTWTQIQVGL